MVIGIMVLSVAAVVAAGTLLGNDRRARRIRPWVTARLDRLVARVGASAASAVLLVGGVAVTLAVSFPLGLLARALEGSVDRPVFRYFAARLHPGWWKDLNDLLTLMGNRPEIKVACVVGGVLLALLWRRRGWYVPLVAIGVTFVAEKYLQRFLAVAVDRGHPPTSLGTYPSGGCARLLSVYGVMLFLGLATAPRISRAWRVGLWTLLAAAGAVEGYTRVYLLKHWLTDVVGGLAFGTLLLATMVGGAMALAAVSGQRKPSADRGVAELAPGRHRAKAAPVQPRDS